MRNKVLSMALGALACIFLAVVPVAAADGSSGDGSEGLLLNLYHQILEWFGAADGMSDVTPSDPTPASAALSGAGGSGGPDNPEAYPYIPPGG